MALISASDIRGRPYHAPPLSVAKSTPFPSLTTLATGVGLATGCAPALTFPAALLLLAAPFSSDRFPKNLMRGVRPPVCDAAAAAAEAAAGCDAAAAAGAAGAGAAVVVVVATPSVSNSNSGCPTVTCAKKKKE